MKTKLLITLLGLTPALVFAQTTTTKDFETPNNRVVMVTKTTDKNRTTVSAVGEHGNELNIQRTTVNTPTGTETVTTVNRDVSRSEINHGGVYLYAPDVLVKSTTTVYTADTVDGATTRTRTSGYVIENPDNVTPTPPSY